MSPARLRGFHRLIADLFPTEETVARYREAQSNDEPDLCGCGNYPAVHAGRCFSCLSRGIA